MSTAGTLEILARELGNALQPLATQLTPANAIRTFASLGLNFPPSLLQPGFTAALNGTTANVAALGPALAALTSAISSGDTAGILTHGTEVLTKVAATISSFDNIGSQLSALAGSLGLPAAEVNAFAAALPRVLLDYALISYLETRVANLTAVLAFAGVIERTDQPVGPDSAHPPFTVRKFHLDRLPALLQSPTGLVGQVYGWGKPGFDGRDLVLGAARFLRDTHIPASFDAGPPPVATSGLFDIQPDLGLTPPGVDATLKLTVPGGFDFSVPLTPRFSLYLTTKGDFGLGNVFKISPPARVSIQGGPADGRMSVQITGAGGASPFVLIGQTGGSGIQADSISFGVGLEVKGAGGGSSDLDLLVTFAFTGAKAVIDASQGDGFLQSVLSGVHIEAGFSLSGTWRADTGLHIDGGSQVEIDLPLHLNLGPVTLPTFYLVAGLGGAMTLEASAELGLTLGPIQVSVDRLGVKGFLTFPPKNGNLGPADLQIKFKPPSGLGLQIDAGPVVGGGYVFFDPDKGQYAGVLDVSIIEIIQVKIIAVLDTILPDGSKGFSLLLIITFDFPPIQLSFGFTLNGVGGLGGVNRTMNIEALHAGFRAHQLNSIMFPPDPVKNAPQIISNIRNFFPPAGGRYLFGPMLEVGWGEPMLITLSVGVILEVPDPIRLALIGLIASGLPTLDVPLIELHIDVLGTLDFGTKTLEIDGSLYDSHVLIYSLAGDLFFRLNWGDNPAFIFSLGGFHPKFNTAGLNIPPLQRMSVSIGDGDNPRISSNSYFAITSNTLQFGANVEAYASAAGFSVHGYLGFDVLIIFSPFSFEFDFSAGFDISFEGHSIAGLTINGLFSGPRPWHLHGDASFHILFFSVSASIDLSWGDSTPAILPAKPVQPDLLAALEAVNNWSAALPDGATQGVTLATPPPGSGTLRVHPMGTLAVKENVVPLDLPITRYGNATPADGNYFSITNVQSNGQDEQTRTFQDYFATGQFQALSDADKLSRPSFERYDAGVTIGSSAIIGGADSPRTVNYEERYVPDPNAFSVFSRVYAMSSSVHLALTRQGAGYTAGVRNSGLVKYANGPAQAAVSAADAAYVIAGTDDLAIRSDISSGGGVTYFHAQAALRTYVAAHPEQAASLQIVPMHEVGL